MNAAIAIIIVMIQKARGWIFLNISIKKLVSITIIRKIERIFTIKPLFELFLASICIAKKHQI